MLVEADAEGALGAGLGASAEGAAIASSFFLAGDSAAGAFADVVGAAASLEEEVASWAVLRPGVMSLVDAAGFFSFSAAVAAACA